MSSFKVEVEIYTDGKYCGEKCPFLYYDELSPCCGLFEADLSEVEEFPAMGDVRSTPPQRVEGCFAAEKGEDFWAGTELASRMVANWPKWKRDMYEENDGEG